MDLRGSGGPGDSHPGTAVNLLHCLSVLSPSYLCVSPVPMPLAITALDGRIRMRDILVKSGRTAASALPGAPPHNQNVAGRKAASGGGAGRIAGQRNGQARAAGNTFPNGVTFRKRRPRRRLRTSHCAARLIVLVIS